MDNKKQLLVLIIAGVLLFLLGGVAGVVYMQTGSRQTKISTADSLASKVVSSIVAYGQVKNINGRNITLSNLGDSLTISIANNAQVYSFAVGKKGGAPVQQTVKFEDIKIGNKVNVAIKLLPSGQLEGSSVIILP